MLPHGLLVLIHIHVVIYSPRDLQSLLSNLSKPAYYQLHSSISSPWTCWLPLCLSTSSFSVYSYWQLESLLLALAVGFLSRLAGTPICETIEGRMLTVGVRRRWGCHYTQNLSLGWQCPRSIHPSPSCLRSSKIICSPRQELVHAAHGYWVMWCELLVCVVGITKHEIFVHQVTYLAPTYVRFPHLHTQESRLEVWCVHSKEYDISKTKQGLWNAKGYVCSGYYSEHPWYREEVVILQQSPWLNDMKSQILMLRLHDTYNKLKN